MQQKRATDMLR